MKNNIRWMSYRLFRLAMSEYPGPKIGLTQMTEQDLTAIPGFVLATRTNEMGETEYLLNLEWPGWR